MANKVISFTIKAKDLATEKIGKLSNSFKILTGKAKKANKALSTQSVMLKAIEKQTNAVAKAEKKRRFAGLGGGITRGLSSMNRGIGAGLTRLPGIARGAFGSIARMARRTATVGVAAFGLLGMTVKKAFDREALTASFSVLLGGMDKATTRIKELVKFSDETPFELDELAKANRLLQVFGGEATGSVDRLRQLGDVAGATQNDIESLAFWFGRIVATTSSGLIDGEALRRLQEMGIMSNEARGEMEKMGKTKDVAKVLELWDKQTRKLSGGMALLAKTGTGLTSTLKQQVNNAFVEFGQVLQGDAKKGLANLIARIQELRTDGTIKRWGDETLSVLTDVGGKLLDIFGSDQAKKAAAIKSMSDTIEQGVKMGMDKLVPLVAEFAEKIAAPVAGGILTGLGRGALDQSMKLNEAITKGKDGSGGFVSTVASSMASVAGMPFDALGSLTAGIGANTEARISADAKFIGDKVDKLGEGTK